MKKILLIVGGVLLLGLIAAPFALRKFGSQIIQVPPPTGLPIGEVDLPRPEQSLLAVQIVVPVATLQETLNAEAPTRLEGQEKKDFHKRVKNGSYAWAVERGDVVLQNTGTAVAFAAPIQGAAQVQGIVDARIVKLPISGTAQITGTLAGTLSPQVSPQWEIIPNLVPAVKLSSAELNIANLAQFDIKDLLESQLNPIVQKEAAKLGPKLQEQVDLKSEVRDLWLQGHLVEEISDDPAVWLTVDPLGIQASPILYTDPENISTTIAIIASTSVTNIEPAALAPKPLPPLSLASEAPRTDVRIPLVVGITRLNEALGRETFKAETSFGADIEFTGVEARIGQNGLVNFNVELVANHGALGHALQGNIWLQGKPIIDYEKQILAFSEVDLTVETRDRLTATAAWLLEGVLVKAVQKELRVSLDRYRDELDEELGKLLNSSKLPEGLEISIKDFDVRLADIYTTTRQVKGGDPDPGVVLVISASGAATSKLTKFK